MAELVFFFTAEILENHLTLIQPPNRRIAASFTASERVRQPIALSILWCISSLSPSFHPTICGTLDVMPPPPVFCPEVVVSLRVMSGSTLYCTWYREIRGWQPYRSRWHHMPGSVSSDKVGYCKLAFTLLGNIYLKYRWVFGGAGGLLQRLTRAGCREGM